MVWLKKKWTCKKVGKALDGVCCCVQALKEMSMAVLNDVHKNRQH